VRDSASLESVRSKLTQLHAALGSAGAAAAVAAGGTSESFAKPPSNVPMPVEGEATALAGEIVELVSASFKQTEKFSSFAKNSIFFLFFFFFFFFFFLFAKLRTDIRAHELPLAASMTLASPISLLNVRPPNNNNNNSI
jgi:hypothetical protein